MLPIKPNNGGIKKYSLVNTSSLEFRTGFQLVATTDLCRRANSKGTHSNVGPTLRRGNNAINGTATLAAGTGWKPVKN